MTITWSAVVEAAMKILERLGTLLAAYFAGRASVKKQIVEEDLEQAKHDAQAWANRPVGDTADRLRALAAKKREDRS